MHACEKEAELSVGSTQRKGHLKALARGDRRLPAFEHAGQLGGVVDALPAPAFHLLLRRPRVFIPPPVIPVDEAVGLRRPRQLRDILREPAKLILLLPQHLFGPLPRRDVARDLRGADDFSRTVDDRRGSERDVDQRAILASPHGFKMFDSFAAPDVVEDIRLLRVAFGGNEHEHRLADDLLRGVAKEPLRPAVPTGDDAVEGFRNDRVVRIFDDRRESGAGRALGEACGDVHVHAGEPRGPAARVARGLEAAGEPTHAAIRPHHAPLAHGGLAGRQRLPHAGDGGGAVLGMHEVFPRGLRLGKAADGEPVEFLELRRPEVDACLDVPIEAAHVRRLLRYAQPLLAFAQHLGDADQLGVPRGEFVVERGQLLVARLHLLLRGFQLLVDDLHLLIGGLRLFIGRAQLLGHGLVLFADREHGFAHRGEFLGEVQKLLVARRGCLGHAAHLLPPAREPRAALRLRRGPGAFIEEHHEAAAFSRRSLDGDDLHSQRAEAAMAPHPQPLRAHRTAFLFRALQRLAHAAGQALAQHFQEVMAGDSGCRREPRAGVALELHDLQPRGNDHARRRVFREQQPLRIAMQHPVPRLPRPRVSA